MNEIEALLSTTADYFEAGLNDQATCAQLQPLLDAGQKPCVVRQLPLSKARGVLVIVVVPTSS